ncbi:magnesium-translocating P-type ATPase [Georgenia yuyongxinii]|uniref:Magnesium-transporting ATPase, P-type 1 n=1 Tax=Georgenia yuyongxinii TaxID=2589797 RepID=A0A552WK36_9MICO|nr:magnesium-translocating P-type ATPase [Georgenia yuyongxinii]TRW43096.1 magnesium-translocating P-type ATPase [Georgenia yuyongxinii]
MVPRPEATAVGAPSDLAVGDAAALTAEESLGRLGTSRAGLDTGEVAERRLRFGVNAVRSDRARLGPLVARQLRSPLLLLLAVAALASYFVGERASAVIIGAILVFSVGLGIVNEFRAARAAEALHGQIRHSCVVRRDGHPVAVDVVDLVPGDVVELRLGEVVPADLRLLDVAGLECDEGVLTGESVPVTKSVSAVAPGAALADLTSAALMGTVVHSGSAVGVVVATAGRAEFGRIAVGLAEGEPETEFQVGLRQFSLLLVQVGIALTVAIFVINVALQRPVLDALLFSLAIAVGISPQLLPAVVSTSLAAGSRRLARSKVLVKRLVCIEDLGNIEVLFTDKTGTLTEGQITFQRAVGPDGAPDAEVLSLGLLCSEPRVTGQPGVGNALDEALWAGAGPPGGITRYRRLALLPFDHDRRLVSALVADGDGVPTLVAKGAPEGVLERCADVPGTARAVLDSEFAAGGRVVAVATRLLPGRVDLRPDDERELSLRGFLVFLDSPKASAAGALARLAGLGLTVKVVTGDNAHVAIRVCEDLGLPATAVATGADLEAVDDAQLVPLVARSTVFARVSPAQKARIVRAQRSTGRDVAFLGDGVNDALALHAADVGISVDSAADVAKDAADIILLEKDLDVLADGVVGGRRIFANTIKYVLMGTSSNFGNMFSAAGASALLAFLPMLPSQILLNNLLYDSSQLAIPTDRVDAEQLARPARWDVHFIRRFMLFFGPISSVFDFLTFGVMLWVFGAGPELFHTGWFVESLATQCLVIFVIRTRRVPFFRSRPGAALTVAMFGIVAIGALLPVLPVADALGFQPLPPAFFGVLVLLVVCYLGLMELGKAWFYRSASRTAASRTAASRTAASRTAASHPAAVHAPGMQPSGARPRREGYRVLRRSRRFSAAPRRPRPGRDVPAVRVNRRRRSPRAGSRPGSTGLAGPP